MDVGDLDCPAKVTQLNCMVFCDEEIRRLDIQMDEAFFMDVADWAGYVCKYAPNFFLLKELLSGKRRV